MGTGSTSKNGQTLIYTVTSPVNVPAGVYIRLEVWNIINPPSLGGLSVQVTTKTSGGATIDSGTSNAYSVKQIGTGDISDNAITSAKIQDGQVATADIANNATTSAKIEDGQVKRLDIADNAITSAKIMDGQITSAKIADGTIIGSDLAPGALQTSSHVSDYITIPGGYFFSTDAICPAGEIVTGGGYNVGSASEEIQVIISEPSLSINGWHIHAWNQGTVDHTIRAHVVCLKPLLKQINRHPFFFF